MREIRKALTFRASSIGDCLMGKYLLDNIHAQFPQAKLGIVVGSRGAMIMDLLAAYPYIEVIEANRRSPRALWRLWRQWRGSDLVVTQYAGKSGGKFSLASKLVARLLARDLIGFADTSVWNKFLYSYLIPFDPQAAPAEMERRALQSIGVPVVVPYPKLAPASEIQTLHRFGLVSGKYVLVHLSSGSKKRGLSPERRRELVAAMVKSNPGVEVVVTGSKAEKEDALSAAAGTQAKVIADASLQELMALVAESRGVVAVDTGVAHIAAQLGKPLAVLTSCLGAQWWVAGQYGAPPSVRVLTNKAACGSMHELADYPPCLNTISYDHLFLYV